MHDGHVGGVGKNSMLVFMIYMIVQAVIGILAIEYALSRSARMAKVDEERDGNVPFFRRLDAKNWTRWKLYPGAMLIMPTRIILLILDVFFLTAIVR